MANKDERNVANLGYAIVVTAVIIVGALFFYMGTGISFGAIIGVFNLIAVMYWGKTIVDKLDKNTGENNETTDK